MGGFGPSCDRGNGGGGGSSLSSCQLLHLPEPERGMVEAMEGEVVVGCSCRLVVGAFRKRLLLPETVSREESVAATNGFMGATFYRG